MLRYFYSFLDNPHKLVKLDIPKYINLKCDAKYFGRFGCTLVFKERDNVIFWEYFERENYFNYRYCFSMLFELGYIVKSVTSDKHGSVVSAVKTAYPTIPHQFCLVHIQRRCQSLLTQNPETKAGLELLEIVRFLNSIKSDSDKQIFIKWVYRFEERYKAFINQRTYSKNPKLDGKTWWYTHKNLRLAFRTIKSSLDNMFFYLEDSNIPKDTNGLEGEFTHLKIKLNMHRGLSKNRRKNFVNWYWFLKSIYSKNN